MRRYVRFFPMILVALVLAAGGSNMILRQASAQKSGASGGAQGGAQKGGPKDGAPTLGPEAQRQIKALLDEKRSRTPDERKISAHLLNAMRAHRGQAMTPNGEVRSLTSAMTMAKPDSEGQVLVNIKGEVTKEMAM